MTASKTIANAIEAGVTIPKIIERQLSNVQRHEGFTYGDGTSQTIRLIIIELLKAQRNSPDPLTPKLARIAIARALRILARDHGQNPTIEIASRSTLIKGYICEGEDYAGWESGPYQWAIPASNIINDMFDNLLVEPYFSFDLTINCR